MSKKWIDPTVHFGCGMQWLMFSEREARQRGNIDIRGAIQNDLDLLASQIRDFILEVRADLHGCQVGAIDWMPGNRTWGVLVLHDSLPRCQDTEHCTYAWLFQEGKEPFLDYAQVVKDREKLAELLKALLDDPDEVATRLELIRKEVAEKWPDLFPSEPKMNSADWKNVRLGRKGEGYWSYIGADDAQVPLEPFPEGTISGEARPGMAPIVRDRQGDWYTTEAIGDIPAGTRMIHDGNGMWRPASSEQGHTAEIDQEAFLRP